MVIGCSKDKELYFQYKAPLFFTNLESHHIIVGRQRKHAGHPAQYIQNYVDMI